MKVALAGVLALVCIGCATMTIPGATMKDGMCVFSAEGQAVAAKEDDPRAMAEARVAAAAVAKANLLEKVKGAFLSSRTTVGDLMFRSHEVDLKVSGFLSRATVTFKPAPETRLGPTSVVTAVAELILTPDEVANLVAYVE